MINTLKPTQKSQGLGFILTLLLGPLGLFYSSWVAALILCVVAITSAASIIGPIVCWILTMIIGFLRSTNTMRK